VVNHQNIMRRKTAIINAALGKIVTLDLPLLKVRFQNIYSKETKILDFYILSQVFGGETCTVYYEQR